MFFVGEQTNKTRFVDKAILFNYSVLDPWSISFVYGQRGEGGSTCVPTSAAGSETT